MSDICDEDKLHMDTSQFFNYKMWAVLQILQAFLI